MPTATVEDGTSFAPAPPPEQPAASQVVGSLLSPVMALGPAGHLGPKVEVEKELDLIAASIRVFYAKPADMVLRECSAFTARLTELAVLLHRIEGHDRQYTRVRTQQVERYLLELDRQWKTASRLIEVSRQDIQVLRGQA